MPKKLTTEEFVEKAKKIHGDKYDYSKVEYINNRVKVCIICPIHGEFWQTPLSHLTLSRGCAKCKGGVKIDKNTFIQKAQKIHGNKYDYSKVDYINTETKVCIICPIHGEFWQTPHSHIGSMSTNCPQCMNRQLTREEFIEKAKAIHGDKFDYSKVEYINAKTKVCIICPKHGEFWQTPTSHLRGNGCSMCNESKLEREIKLYLEQHGIVFQRQHKFKELGRQSLDFYLPEYNVAIECQGRQHFVDSAFKRKKMRLKHQIELDVKKQIICQEHGIKVLYYSNLDIVYPYHVFEDKDELLNEIKKHESNSTQSEQ